MALGLDPKYVLVNDKSRILCKAKRFQDGPDDLLVLHPTSAVIIALMDGVRDEQEVRSLVEDVFGLTPEESRKALASVKGSYGQVLCNLTQPRLLDPTDYIIPSSQIDLGKIRCELPVTLNVNVTWRCNRSCQYCYSEPPSSGAMELPFPSWERLFRDASEMGITSVQLNGGDFFCRSDWRDLVHLLCTCGIFPIVSTKQYISRDDALYLLDHGVDELQVSLDSHDPEICSQLTRTPGYLSIASSTIRNLTSVGVTVRVNVVVTSLNVRSVRPTVNLLESLGCSRATFTACTLSLYRDNSALLLSRDEKNTLAESVESYSGPVAISYSYRDDPLDGKADMATYLSGSGCGAGRHALSILPDGDVVPCETLPSRDFSVGNILHQRLDEIWRAPALERFVSPSRKKDVGQACETCVEFNRCRLSKGTCVRDTLAAYGSPFFPDPRCPNAPPGRRYC